MKPLSNTQPKAPKCPLVDYHYDAQMLNASSAPRLKVSKSLRHITRANSGHNCNFAFKTGRAERRSVDRLGRYRQTRSNGATGTRPWHSRTGRHSLDSGKHRRASGENKYLAGDKS